MELPKQEKREIAIMGHGVVGSGTAEVFLKNRESVSNKLGFPVSLKYVLDLREFPETSYADRFIKDFETILNDDEISVVAELIGGLNPAYDYVKALLLKGKSVATSNKELVAKKGAELLKIARDKNVNFLFEASVGGGIPIIRPLHQCLSADTIYEIAGILNGTTNFILTKMLNEKMDFQTALKLAQENGYAERDPSDDINGTDACRKICILASLAFGKQVNPEYVPTRGITEVTPADFAYCENNGYSIKLIARAVKRGADKDEKIDVEVCPAFVSKKNLLSSVNDVYNAILVRGEATGDAVFYGKGAGKFPTASAVVNDIVNALKSSDNSRSLFWEENLSEDKDDYKNMKSRYYIVPENESAFLTSELTLEEFDRLKQEREVLNYMRVFDNL